MLESEALRVLLLKTILTQAKIRNKNVLQTHSLPCSLLILISANSTL